MVAWLVSIGSPLAKYEARSVFGGDVPLAELAALLFVDPLYIVPPRMSSVQCSCVECRAANGTRMSSSTPIPAPPILVSFGK
jgi:hypothetical protein